MKINVIDGFDEVHGAPEGWTPEKQGECIALPTRRIVDRGTVYRVSEFEFEEHEIADLIATRRLHLWVSSPDAHPVVSITVARFEVDTPPEG